MLENEVKTILNQQKNSIELLKKLHSIYKPYNIGQKEHKNIFYLDIRIEQPAVVENRTRQAFKSILDFYHLTPINGRGTAGTIEQIAEDIQNLTIKDFYYSLVKYMPYNSKEYELKNMSFSEKRSYYKRMILALNCIWLLENEQPINRDLYNKIYKLRESGNTFIFRGCKITHYKNTNLKIQFSSAKMFEKFERNFKEAFKLAEEEKAQRDRKEA